MRTSRLRICGVVGVSLLTLLVRAPVSRAADQPAQLGLPFMTSGSFERAAAAAPTVPVVRWSTGHEDALSFHGITGQRRTFGLQGGRYVLSVYAAYNGLPPTTTSACAFTAVLTGIEHPLTGGQSLLGSLQVGALFPYHYIPTLNLPQGHYILDVSALTDCTWSVSIGGGGTGHPFVGFSDVGIYHQLAGKTEKTTIVETTGKPYAFSVAYNAWGAGFAMPTASLTLLQGGHALSTVPLTNTAGAYGQTAFSTPLMFPPGQHDRPGAYTARYRVTLGGRTFTTSLPYTLQDLGPGTWALQHSGTATNLNHVACPTRHTCIAAGKGATVLATTDGRTWTRRSTPLGSSGAIDLDDATCPTAQICYAVGDQYAIVKSADGGQTWSQQSGDQSYTSYGQSFIGVECPTTRHCYAVGTGGIIAATTDGGAHWNLQAKFASGKDLADVTCPTETTCFAVGLDGTILHTSNAGATWQRRTVGAPYLFSVTCPAARICYATGQQGAILKTADGGTTWERQNNPLAGSHLWVDSVSCSSVLLCHAVGQGGTLLLTTNGGRSWRSQATPLDTQLNAVSCPDAGTCYAAGSGGVIVKGG